MVPGEYATIHLKYIYISYLAKISRAALQLLMSLNFFLPVLCCYLKIVKSNIYILNCHIHMYYNKILLLYSLILGNFLGNDSK